MIGQHIALTIFRLQHKALFLKVSSLVVKYLSFILFLERAACSLYHWNVINSNSSTAGIVISSKLSTNCNAGSILFSLSVSNPTPVIHMNAEAASPKKQRTLAINVKWVMNELKETELGSAVRGSIRLLENFFDLGADLF